MTLPSSSSRTPGSAHPAIQQAGLQDAAFGRDVKIVHPVNLYGYVIGDNCFIGPFVAIQRNVRIGARTRVQSHTFICKLVTIGDRYLRCREAGRRKAGVMAGHPHRTPRVDRIERDHHAGPHMRWHGHRRRRGRHQGYR
jgi:carbonic anhydrase/acetyltransferase-like protein (isoleucine patch superfamily)